MLQFDYIKDRNRQCYYYARIGCIDIAHVWSPRKGTRDKWMVRLMFIQERGKVDFSKDKHFATLEECKHYINTNFKVMLRKLALNYDIVKWKNCNKGDFK